jgi:hypothetical protein
VGGSKNTQAGESLPAPVTDNSPTTGKPPGSSDTDPPSLNTDSTHRERVIRELKDDIRRLREQIRELEAKTATPKASSAKE